MEYLILIIGFLIGFLTRQEMLNQLKKRKVITKIPELTIDSSGNFGIGTVEKTNSETKSTQSVSIHCPKCIGVDVSITPYTAPNTYFCENCKFHFEA